MDLSNVEGKVLLQELRDRVIINSKDNSVKCPSCGGLRIVMVDSHIEMCRDCYTGVVYTCGYCGKQNRSNYCDCDTASAKRWEKRSQEEKQKEMDNYEKAEKIHYEDYDGYYMIDDKVEDSDYLYDWLYDLVRAGEKTPKYIWTVEKELCFHINLEDIIFDKCENGYEEMFDNLDSDDEFLIQAQGFVDKWEISQGDRLYSFYESGKKVVLIEELVEKIKSDINSCKDVDSLVEDFCSQFDDSFY